MNFENKKILIAGAAGFVPGHLSEFLLNSGAYVTGLDNFITGTKENLRILEKFPRFDFSECNIYENIPDDIKKKKYDYIFSMASPASPIDFRRIPLEIMRVNSEGTLALLEIAKSSGAQFLEASTSEVYGDPEIHPQEETYVGHVNPIGSRSCYDESKRYAEALTASYSKKYGVESTIVRIFNTYGPRMRPDDGRVIPNFVNQAIKKEPLSIYGTGEQTRSFCYVDDLIQGLLASIGTKELGPFNVGNPEEKSIVETAHLINEILDNRSNISFSPLPHADDPKRRCPNISRLQRLTSFVPKVSFDVGIRRTIEYFQCKLVDSSKNKDGSHENCSLL